MGKNLLKNNVVVVKEFNPTNPDAPDWYKKIEKGALNQTGFTPDADRIRIMFNMFKSAIEKTNSLKPKDIAYALEGMKSEGLDGDFVMRKDDHQIHFNMQALLLKEKDKQSIIYRDSDSDMTYKKVGNIPIEEITLETTCKMKRP